MQFALVDGTRALAARGRSGQCPQCHALMIPKCGRLVVHHWAHEATNCDPWWEPETAWHRQWKTLFPASQVEVSRAQHRADIVRANGCVVELQHSPISVDEIAARERAYGSMLWLFDGRDLQPHRLLLRPQPTHTTFRWKHPRKHYAACRAPVYIDLGDQIFRLQRLHLTAPPYGGWGTLQPRYRFIAWLVS